MIGKFLLSFLNQLCSLVTHIFSAHIKLCICICLPTRSDASDSGSPSSFLQDSWLNTPDMHRQCWAQHELQHSSYVPAGEGHYGWWAALNKSTVVKVFIQKVMDKDSLGTCLERNLSLVSSQSSNTPVSSAAISQAKNKNKKMQNS